MGTSDFQEFLGSEPGAVLPVVFVRNAVLAQERQSASELGIVPCDGNGIHQLQEKTQVDSSPEEIFQFLRSLGGLNWALFGLPNAFP